MPDTTSVTRRAIQRKSRVTRGVAERKWLSFLALMLMAIVLDGIAVFDLSQSTKDAVASNEQTMITLPADRCDPGCTIMMASNQNSDRL